MKVASTAAPPRIPRRTRPWLARGSWAGAALLGGLALLGAARKSSSSVTAHAQVPRPTAAAAIDPGVSPTACAKHTEPSDARPSFAMIRVDAGEYRPFFRQESVSKADWVDAFLLDRLPVTRGSYLEFVRLRPRWRKSAVKALFAERTYLLDWTQDLDPGPGAPEKPVTFVSWFAAAAYCECHGKRLPTVAEWERALALDPVASAERASPSRSGAGSQFRFAMGGPSDDRESALGFGGVWEWTRDFNSVLISGRSDTGSGSSLFCGDGYRANDARDYGGFLRHSFRASLKAGYTLKNLGFRCAKDAS